MTSQNETKVRKEVKRLTYTQDWTSYNTAKCQEKRVAQALLMDLMEEYHIQQPKRPGRPALPLKEQLLCMFIYSYSRFSARRCISDLEWAKQLGILSRTPHFNSILAMFQGLNMTRHLITLVKTTALPLKSFEEHLAIDSTGFSTSSFARWKDIRTHKTKKTRQWRKIHLITGTRTHIIIGIAITSCMFVPFNCEA